MKQSNSNENGLKSPRAFLRDGRPGVGKQSLRTTFENSDHRWNWLAQQAHRLTAEKTCPSTTFSRFSNHIQTPFSGFVSFRREMVAICTGKGREISRKWKGRNKTPSKSWVWRVSATVTLVLQISSKRRVVGSIKIRFEARSLQSDLSSRDDLA